MRSASRNVEPSLRPKGQVVLRECGEARQSIEHLALERPVDRAADDGVEVAAGDGVHVQVAIKSRGGGRGVTHVH